MKMFLKPGAGAALALTVGALGACDNGPSAVETRADRSGGYASRDYAAEDRGSTRSEARREPAARAEAETPTINGAPMWSASQRYTAEENARRSFERNGADFGARDMDDFVRKAHAFVDKPPRGTETLTRRNGDTLFYNAERNVFAVANRDGAPRTMFKPDEGAAYWEEQKGREAARAERASRRDEERDAG
jgi:pyocin large subunit-like protein